MNMKSEKRRRNGCAFVRQDRCRIICPIADTGQRRVKAVLLKTAGLVIREKKQSEQDSLVTLLTPENGVILARVRGARRLRGRLAASTELFAYSEFSLFLRDGVSAVDAAEPKRIFYGLRADPEAFALAAYLSQLTYDFAGGQSDTAFLLRLLLNALAFLEEKTMPQLLVKAVFEWQCMAVSGYHPDLSACCRCGASRGRAVWFFPQQGQLICENCGGGEIRGGRPLSADLLLAMKRAMSPDLREAFSFRLGEANCRRFASLAEEYLLTRLEYQPKTLQYYHSLIFELPMPEPKKPEQV